MTRAGDRRYGPGALSPGGEEQRRAARERRYATAPHRPPDGAARDGAPGGHRAAEGPRYRAQGRERAWWTARRTEAQAGRGRRRGDAGSGPPDAAARAQQSRPATATRCPAPARDPPDGQSVLRRGARPWDRAEPCPDKLPGRGPSPPGALYTLGGVPARGSGTSRAGRPGAGSGSGCRPRRVGGARGSGGGAGGGGSIFPGRSRRGSEAQTGAGHSLHCWHSTGVT